MPDPITPTETPAAGGLPVGETEATPAAPATPEPSITFTTNDGEQVTVSQSDAASHFLRQKDYTQKTQALSEQREALAEAEALRVALEADPARTLSVLSEVYGIEGAQQASQSSTPEEPAFVDPDEERWSRVENFIEQTEQTEAERAVEAEFQALEQQVGELDRNELISFAIEYEIPNLRVAHGALEYAKQQWAQQQQAQEQSDAQALAAKQQASFVEGGHSPAQGAVVAGEGERIETPRDAWRKAKAQLGYQP